MSLALTSRWFGADAGPPALARGLAQVRIPALVLDDPPGGAVRWREALKVSGVSVVAVRANLEAAPAAASGAPAAVAAALKAHALVVGGGPLASASPSGPAFATAPVGKEERQTQRRRAGERQVEALARALHDPLAAGVPLAIVHAAGPDDLLRIEECGWLLDALPRLSLWLDPAWALALERQGVDVGPAAWADRLAGRVVGVTVHGLGSDGKGHAHPEDHGPAWSSLAHSLPRRVPWALDLSGRLTAADVREAARYLESAFAALR